MFLLYCNETPKGVIFNKNKLKLIEGIRAMLVDHDNTPVWTPGSLVEVTDEMVDSYFQHLAPEKELVLLDHRL